MVVRPTCALHEIRHANQKRLTAHLVVQLSQPCSYDSINAHCASLGRRKRVGPDGIVASERFGSLEVLTLQWLGTITSEGIAIAG